MGWTVTQIASVVLCAMGAGLAFSCFGHTPVLGYIIAGLLLGPSCFSLISDYNSVTLCSELGIIFLLFIIGQGLSFEKIRNIWKTSVTVTITSTLCTYIILAICGWMFNISQRIIAVFAFCISLSSTAITVKSLETLPKQEDSVSETTLGILIVQDLIALLMVLIINMIAPKSDIAFSFKLTKLIALAIFAAGVFGYFLYIRHHSQKMMNFLRKHNDMMSLIIFCICLGSAVLAELAGFSGPFGAFIAGLILGNSGLKEDAKSVSQPIEEILLMTFFLSVGLMVDLKFIWHNLGIIIIALFYITVGKTALNIFIFRLFKFPLKDSFIISVLLGHIGEFSFMLAFAACQVGILGEFELKFLVCLTALSLFLSPFWLIFAERCRKLTTLAIDSSWGLFQLIVAREERKCMIAIQYCRTTLGPIIVSSFNKAKILIDEVKKRLKK